MKKLTLLIVLSILLSCGNKENGVDRDVDVLSKKEMIAVLIDMSVLEAHISINFLQPEVYSETMLKSAEVIFDKHKIDEETYLNSLNYYANRPDELNDIYTELIDSLQIALAKIQR